MLFEAGGRLRYLTDATYPHFSSPVFFLILDC